MAKKILLYILAWNKLKNENSANIAIDNFTLLTFHPECWHYANKNIYR